MPRASASLAAVREAVGNLTPPLTGEGPTASRTAADHRSGWFNRYRAALTPAPPSTMKRRPASTAAFSPRCAVGAETEARSPATRLLIPTSLLRFRFAALCITTTTAAMGFGSMVRSKASQAPMTSRSSWPPWCAAGFSATHCTAFLNDRWIAASRWEADFLARWMEIGWVASRLAISSVRSFSVCPSETTRVATACKCCDPEAYSSPADEPGAPAIAVEVGCSSSRMSPAPAKASTNSTTSLRRGASGRSERSRSTAVSQDTSGVETPPARCGAPGGRMHDCTLDMQEGSRVVRPSAIRRRTRSRVVPTSTPPGPRTMKNTWRPSEGPLRART